MIKRSKIFNIILIVCVLFFNIAMPSNVEAKTLGNLKSELEKLLKEDQEVSNKIKYTNEQINKANNTINQLYKELDRIGAEIEQTNKEIAELGIKIDEKGKEIKNVVSFIQMSSSDSLYLEYIAGAENLTDFVYRLSVSQQLLEYNDQLIKEMNQMITDNNNKKEELNRKQEEAKNKQQELYNNLKILNRERTELYEYNFSLEEEIALARKTIDMYIQAGCKDHEDLNVCANKILPPDTKLWRPTMRGYVTSEFGERIDPFTGKGTVYHSGIDISDRYKDNSSKIYAAATGKVSATGYSSSMGYYVFIHHNINGEKLTTSYYHMRAGSITVKTGQLVSKDTVIGVMGTTGSSTGVHLHFGVSRGLRMAGTDFNSNLVNPRTYVNFPSSLYRDWSDRTRRYN